MQMYIKCMHTDVYLNTYIYMVDCKDRGHDSSPKEKPKCLDRHLVTGCSLCHKSLSKYLSKVVSITLGSSDSTDAENGWLLVNCINWRDLNVATQSPDRCCSDSGSKLCYWHKMAAFVSTMFWLHILG